MTGENRSLRRELWLVEAYAVTCTLAFAAFLLVGHRRAAHSFDTITVRRINVVDGTGRPAGLVSRYWMNLVV